MSHIVNVLPCLLQAHALQKHIAQLPDPLNIEAVIVSPLSRALQTAVGAFGGGSCQRGDSDKILMVAQDGIHEKQVQHDAVSSAGYPPFVAWEVNPMPASTFPFCSQHVPFELPSA